MSWEPEGALDRVAARVRGYCGYLEARSRRASDRALRRFAVEHLDRAAGAVEATAKEARSSERAQLAEVARGIERAGLTLGQIPSKSAHFLDPPAPAPADRATHATLCALDERIADSARALAVTAETGDYLARDLAAELRRLERALRARGDIMSPGD